MYKVYIQIDAQSRIIAVNSDAFLTDLTNWIQIDEGDGDKYHHAQGNYLPKSIMTAQKIYQYKLVNNVVIERTTKEIAIDIATIPTSPLTLEEEIEQLKNELEAIKLKNATFEADIITLKSGELSKVTLR